MENKLEKILSAAFELFRQHGFKKVTMSDIAAASDMSRPTLYGVFPSKEAVFAALCERQAERGDAQIAEKLARAKSLEARLSLIFEIWIIEPFASVAGSRTSLDLIDNAAVYVPEAYGEVYARFERHLLAVLSPAMSGKRSLAARDLAHILMLATRGLKTSSTTLAELRRMTAGLISMAVATAGQRA